MKKIKSALFLGFALLALTNCVSSQEKTPSTKMVASSSSISSEGWSKLQSKEFRYSFSMPSDWGKASLENEVAQFYAPDGSQEFAVTVIKMQPNDSFQDFVDHKRIASGYEYGLSVLNVKSSEEAHD